MGKKKITGNNNANNKKRLNKNSPKSKRIVLVVTIALVLTVSVGIVGFMTISASKDTNSASQNLTGNWMDIHGLGIYPLENNDDQLYLATHNGLFKKEVGNNSSNSTGWVEVGSDRSDFMGFTINPSIEGIMYSSGHPQTGGNLGFRTSDDYGVTWQKVSDVTNSDPIDFHTMTTGNNPEIMYAASGIGNNIFISTDEGKNWTITSPPGGQQVITLAANQSNSNILFAATTDGLFSSKNQGKNWQKINNSLFNQNDTMVTGIEISLDGKTTFAFVAPNQNIGEEEGYIIKSTDGAKTWTKVDGQISGAQFVSKFAFGNNGNVYITLIQNSEKIDVASSLYSSNDNGNTWLLEGTNNKQLAEM